MTETVQSTWDYITDREQHDAFADAKPIFDTEVKRDDLGFVTNFYGLILLEVMGDDGQIHYARFTMGEPIDSVSEAVAIAAGDVPHE